MKAAALIKEIRESTQHLLRFLSKISETDGKNGVVLF